MLEGVCVDGMRSHPWTQRMPRVHLNDTGAHTPLTLRRSRPLHSVPLAWALGCPPHNPPRECTSVPESILLQPAPNASSETGPGTAPGSASTLLLVAQRSTLSSWLRAELVHVYADQKSSTWVKHASHLRDGWHLSAWRWYKAGHRAHPSGHGRPSHHWVHSGLRTQDILWERQITGLVPCICVDGTFPGLSSLLPEMALEQSVSPSIHPSLSPSHTRELSGWPGCSARR